MKDPMYIIVVLYNKVITEIISLDNFLKVKKTNPVEIVICDNSSEEYQKRNSELLKQSEYQDMIYVNNGGNVGLSKAYNNAIRTIREKHFWVMLADDDTLFSIEYLKNVCQKAESNQHGLIAGILYTGENIFSPVKKYAVLRKNMEFISTPGVYKNIYAVNSGLVIHSSIFDVVGLFDENLFLDMIDYHFMENLKLKEVNEICIVNGRIEQSFSGENSGGWKSDIYRFRILKKDIKYFYRIHKKNFFVMYFILVKRIFHIFLLNFKCK